MEGVTLCQSGAGQILSLDSGTFSEVLLSFCHVENLYRLQLGSASRAAVEGKVLISSFR